jgi:hypothetical protein
MRSRTEILDDEKRMITIAGLDTLPHHTEILLDIRDLLIKIKKQQEKKQK